MRIVGKFKTIYELDGSCKRKDVDGTVYTVKNQPEYKVKIFDKVYCTKGKEQEIDSALSGETSWNGPTLIDLAYAHGKFTGYVFDDQWCSTPEMPVAPVLDEPQVYESETKPSTGIPGYAKFLYLVLMIPVLWMLTATLFFDFYTQFTSGILSSDAMRFCYGINYKGILPCIGGVFATFFALRKSWKKVGNIFFILVPLTFFIGVLFVFIVVTIIVGIVNLAFSVFWALLPAIITIGVIIYVLKSIFRR